MRFVTDEEIAEIKKSHKEIYLTSVGDTEVVFRILSVKEFRESLLVARKESSSDSEEYVIGQAVLWPQDFNVDDHLIGEITSLTDEILEKSGYSDFETCQSLIDQAREEADELVSFMFAMIMASDQGYELSDLEAMNFKELASKAAFAEKIFEIKVAVGQGIPVVLDISVEGEDTEAQPAEKAELTPEEYEAIRRGEFVNPEKASTIGAAPVNDPIARKLQQALG